MKNIAVIIRTFSRVEDAKAQVEIIKKYWNKNNYTLFVSFNGASSGYELDDYVKEHAYIIEVSENTGHINGASDLVKKGYAHIEKENFDYVLFIESDFWLLDEKIIENSIASGKDLASTIWVEKRKSLAVDFFIIKKEVLDKNTQILEWSEHAEIAFKDLSKKANLSVYIQEEMRLIHAPKLFKRICKKALTKYNGEDARFRIFLDAMVISHHIEDLYNAKHNTEIKKCTDGQIEEAIGIKKSIANTLLGEEFFKGVGFYELSFFEKYAQKIARYIPQSSWFRRG